MILHPRRAMAEPTAPSGWGHGMLTVLLCGAIAGVLQLVAGLIEPAGRAPAPDLAIAVSMLLPLLLVAFWFASAALVDVAARRMGGPARRLRFRRLSSHAYPVMVVYALVTAIQSALDRATGTGDAATIVGACNIAVLLWFIALNAVVVHVAYGLQPFAATLTAMVPYAALSTLVMVLIVVASALQVAGLG